MVQVDSLQGKPLKYKNHIGVVWFISQKTFPAFKTQRTNVDKSENKEISMFSLTRHWPMSAVQIFVRDISDETL